ncbi:MAG TPA: M23 family metallopeptidase [Gaiellaceae bacterium]|nr:M23 family metallopeptidase [Gaiellaceae bacterium]
MLFALLMLTTRTPKFALALIAFLIWTPAAYAWSWPVQGPVLKPFSYDAAHPYASGQHRGIDIGADSGGETVVAPAAGTISFAGTVPTNGQSVTIQTADGYSVTLTHLGSILVAKGAVVGEQDAIGTIGPSGTAEEEGPYVHLGIRLTADANGYLDPLSFLPPAPVGGSDGSTSTGSSGSSGSSDSSAPAQPAASSGGSSATPADESIPSLSKTRGSTPVKTQSRVSHQQDDRVEGSGAEVRARSSSQGPAVRSGKPEPRSLRPAQTHRSRPAAPETSLRRPVVETAAPVEPAALDAGHESRPAAPAATSAPARRGMPSGVLPLLLNGAAALVALAAALAAARDRRRRLVESAQVLHLPRSQAASRPESRAA